VINSTASFLRTTDASDAGLRCFNMLDDEIYGYWIERYKHRNSRLYRDNDTTGGVYVCRPPDAWRRWAEHGPAWQTFHGGARNRSRNAMT